MAKNWTRETANKWIIDANRGRKQYGLTYVSACDYLGISIGYAKGMKR